MSPCGLFVPSGAFRRSTWREDGGLDDRPSTLPSPSRNGEPDESVVGKTPTQLEAALAEVEEGAGAQFDPVAAELFVEAWADGWDIWQRAAAAS